MRLRIYQVDAFTTKVFGGNPAAVVPLESWLTNTMLQNIALENNLSETAFFVPDGDGFHLRWFTPKLEIELCGHATLASAYVLFEILKFGKPNIRFNTMSGPLYVKKEHGQLSMDFPFTEMKQISSNPHISAGLLAKPNELYESPTKFMAVYDSASDVYSMDPDYHHLKLAGKNVIITAKGEDCDFISRFFAPVSGIDEDPVTGSAHTALTPYWSKRLGKTELFAKQVSKRGGELICEISGDRVIIKGNARLYMTGELTF
ncbi:MAG: PhzF family phenazine biosynthesis protein [Bacteroidetes bacterium]|nr:PhzF family phenazine biosynthesis protein [Bacteroidota bacterium]